MKERPKETLPSTRMHATYGAVSGLAKLYPQLWLNGITTHGKKSWTLAHVIDTELLAADAGAHYGLVWGPSTFLLDEEWLKPAIWAVSVRRRRSG
jgi:hypothetical protein